MTPFVRHHRRPRGARNHNRIVIYSDGALSISSDVMGRIGNPTRTHLLYDTTTSRIAVQAATANDLDAYAVTARSRNKKLTHGSTVFAGGLLRSLGVDIQQVRGEYTPEFIDERTFSIRLPVELKPDAGGES